MENIYFDDTLYNGTSWLNTQMEQDMPLVAEHIKNVADKYQGSKLETQVESHLLPVFTTSFQKIDDEWQGKHTYTVVEWEDSDKERIIGKAKAYYSFKHYSIPFCLGALALAFPQARLLLLKLRESKFEAVRISSTLALLLISEPIADINIDELSKFIKLWVLFELPMPMYTKILWQLKGVIAENESVKILLAKMFIENNRHIKLVKMTETALLLSELKVRDNEITKALDLWTSNSYDLHPYYKIFRERCIQALKIIIQETKAG